MQQAAKVLQAKICFLATTASVLHADIPPPNAVILLKIFPLSLLAEEATDGNSPFRDIGDLRIYESALIVAMSASNPETVVHRLLFWRRL
ncbi:MAG: hypothetical protein C0406_00065 [Sideroxydans sp.]|nr:hypothetical protein [Sideroxydans sp.]